MAMAAAERWARVQASVLDVLPCESLLRPDHEPLVADPEEPLWIAVQRMWCGQVGALAVLRDGALLGSVGEQALLRATAARLAERADGPATCDVWHDLLGDVRVGDSMTPRDALPVVEPHESLLAGLRRCCEREGLPTRYLFVSGADDGLAGLLSLRDIARELILLYDGRLPRDRFPSDGHRQEARAALREAFDLPLGVVRGEGGLGHEPVVASDRLNGAQVVRAVWEGGRGYVVATFADGAPKGIFTRRDLLRVLSRPFVDLADGQLANWMSASVKTLRDLDTLCGVFKGMAMEGFRHMPLVDEWDRLECVISMWEALWRLAAPPEGSA